MTSTQSATSSADSGPDGGAAAMASDRLPAAGGLAVNGSPAQGTAAGVAPGVAGAGSGSWAMVSVSGGPVPSASAPQQVASRSARGSCTRLALTRHATGSWGGSVVAVLVRDTAWASRFEGLVVTSGRA